MGKGEFPGKFGEEERPRTVYDRTIGAFGIQDGREKAYDDLSKKTTRPKVIERYSEIWER